MNNITHGTKENKNNLRKQYLTIIITKTKHKELYSSIVLWLVGLFKKHGLAVLKLFYAYSRFEQI